MPRFKRWAPIAHGFNRDPQIRELRKRFGDWMGFVWIEMVSIGDMNDGEIKGSVEQIAESLAYISLSKRPSLSAKCITNALQFMRNCGWIELQTDRVLIVNHLKYHPFEYGKAIPPNDLPTDLTNKDSREPQKRNQKLEPKTKQIADQIYNSDPEKFRKLIVWINEKQKRDVADEVIIAVLDQFWQHERKTKIKDWWPYLDRILSKEYGRWHEAQGAKRKQADSEFIKNLISTTDRKMKL